MKPISTCWVVNIYNSHLKLEKPPMNSDPYRRIAGLYDRLFEPMNSGLRSLGMKIYPPQEGMRVLDVGCGTGMHLSKYLKAGCEVYGIDPSTSMLDIARQRLGTNADLYQGSATEMPYENGFFDLVIMMLALHEMKPSTRDAVLQEMKRVQKPDGRILLIDFHPGMKHSFQGWFTRLVILVSEALAGREHFKNHRVFLAQKGLPTLIAKHKLGIEKLIIVGGGNLALFLLSEE